MVKNIQQLPEGFEQEMRALLGTEEEYESYLASFDQPQSSGLRVNTLRWTREDCMEKLPCRTEPIPWIPNGLFYDGEMRLSRDPYYFAGLYYLQEPSAMTPASLLGVRPGDMVLDLCAAPGGKSTELGARLKGQGMLVANDISNSRAKALLKNLELFGIANSCVVSEEPKRLTGVFPEFFDKILVDAPCSGEGMFRKDPDMIKDWVQKGPSYYCKLQKEIVSEAVKMLKAGGSLLYSTCTFSRQEDEEVVRWILDTFEDMELVELERFEGACDGIGLSGCIRLFPHKIRGEGHFIALLRKRKAEEEVSDLRKERPEETDSGLWERKMEETVSDPGRGKLEEAAMDSGKGRPEKAASDSRTGKPEEAAMDSEKRTGGSRSRKAQRFSEEATITGKRAVRSQNKSGGKNFDRKGTGSVGSKDEDTRGREELLRFLEETKVQWDRARITIKEDMIYYLPQGLPEGTGLRFLRTGLWMGTLKHGRFEPSQPMAMVLSQKLYANSISFDRTDERVIRYLKGETICLEDHEEPKTGWCLVCVDGFALGFAKGNGMTLKNKYYPGWRWQ